MQSTIALLHNFPFSLILHEINIKALSPLLPFFPFLSISIQLFWYFQLSIKISNQAKTLSSVQKPELSCSRVVTCQQMQFRLHLDPEVGTQCQTDPLELLRSPRMESLWPKILSFQTDTITSELALLNKSLARPMMKQEMAQPQPQFQPVQFSKKVVRVWQQA